MLASAQIEALRGSSIAVLWVIGYSRGMVDPRRWIGLCSAGLSLVVAVACADGDEDTRGSGSQGTPTTATASVTATDTSSSSGASASSSTSTSTDTVSGGESESAGSTLDTTEGTTEGTTTDATTEDPTEEPTGDPTTDGGLCNTELMVTIRDFTSAHPDFESYTGDVAFLGLVEDTLGDDDKPVYANPGPTPQTSGPDQFLQWYSDTQGVNQTFEVSIGLSESMPGVFTYDNSNFFPIDDQGFGNEGWPHNFLFTTEIHANFKYEGGEVFTFTGDDDLWTFINGRLAIDLGGLHPPLSKTVDLDAMADYLGIEPGGTFPMDIFHAERHTDQSNFRIDTSIQCFIPQ